MFHRPLGKEPNVVYPTEPLMLAFMGMLHTVVDCVRVRGRTWGSQRMRTCATHKRVEKFASSIMQRAHRSYATQGVSTGSQESPLHLPCKNHPPIRLTSKLASVIRVFFEVAPDERASAAHEPFNDD